VSDPTHRRSPSCGSLIREHGWETVEAPSTAKAVRGRTKRGRARIGACWNGSRSESPQWRRTGQEIECYPIPAPVRSDERREWQDITDTWPKWRSSRSAPQHSWLF